MSQALANEIVRVDLTARDVDFRSVKLADGDVALIAVPSYSGRVPAVAATRLEMLCGNGARAILVCVYGNRAYEDTLAELRDTATRAGFRVVAAVAEHSIVRQYGAGRPDAADEAVLRNFAVRIRRKIDDADDSEPKIPGHRPYRKAAGTGLIPKATRSCVQCGVCAAKCPVGAIDPADPTRVDKKVCISCMRCVAVCPHKAGESTDCCSRWSVVCSKRPARSGNRAKYTFDVPGCIQTVGRISSLRGGRRITGLRTSS